jgi:hypothetical protein
MLTLHTADLRQKVLPEAEGTLVIVVVMAWFMFLGQGLAIEPRMTLNSRSSYFCFLSAEIIGLRHHGWQQRVF